MLLSLLKRECIFLLMLVLFFNCISAETDTNLTIPNSAPYLLENIPDFGWAMNTNYNNAFNLNDYFTDLEDVLSFSFSSVENITVVIDVNNNVSFYPQIGFTGIRQVVFYADDGNSVVESNVVNLNVGTDTEPPTWHGPAKSLITVYQNDLVTFTTLWKDNMALLNYTFYINQGVWSEVSGSLSSKEMISSETIKISVAGGSSVVWKFCAQDTSMNLNCTDEQSFFVSSKPTPPSSGDSPSGAPSSSSDSDSSSDSGGTFFSKVRDVLEREELTNYTINFDSFLVELKQGESLTKILQITNIGNVPLEFNLELTNLRDFVLISEKSFKIMPGESKEITIDFITSKNTAPGDYYGMLSVNSSQEMKIPIMFSVNSLSLDFEVNTSVSQDYKSVRPGKEVVANITIKSIKDVLETPFLLTVAIKDFEGNIYDTYEEEIMVSSFLNLEKALQISEDIPLGKYVFYVRISNDEFFISGSDTFEVGIRFQFAAFLKSSFVFILILFLSVFSFILVLRYKRGKERARTLSLYVKLTQMKNLIKKEKFDAAAEVYINIKKQYGEKVSKNILEDKEKLKVEIEKLSKQFVFDDEKKNVEKKEEKSDDSEEINKKEVEESEEKVDDENVENEDEEKGEKNKENSEEEVKEEVTKEESVEENKEDSRKKIKEDVKNEKE